MTSDVIRVARWVDHTAAEGPGSRFAVWVQGCTIRCPGCFNPHLWTDRGGREISPAELASMVPASVEGVTLLGGEPFDQPGPLAEFAELVQERGLTVMTFTGFELAELRLNPAAEVQHLLARTDLLVDGPYLAHELDVDRPWVGSKNQRFHALSDKYEDLVRDVQRERDLLEVRISVDGRVSVNGWASDEALLTLLDGVGKRAREEVG